MWSGDRHYVPRIVRHSSQMLPLLHLVPLPAVRSSPMTKSSTILLPCCGYASPHSSNSHSPPEEQRRQSSERRHCLCCWMRPTEMKTNLLMQRLKGNKVLLTPSWHCFNYSNAKKRKERKKETNGKWVTLQWRCANKKKCVVKLKVMLKFEAWKAETSMAGRGQPCDLKWLLSRLVLTEVEFRSQLGTHAINSIWSIWKLGFWGGFALTYESSTDLWMLAHFSATWAKGGISGIPDICHPTLLR